jgi:hypothetical protein
MSNLPFATDKEVYSGSTFVLVHDGIAFSSRYFAGSRIGHFDFYALIIEPDCLCVIAAGRCRHVGVSPWLLFCN